MNKIQRLLLVLASIGYGCVLFSFLTQDMWVLLLSFIISTALLIAFVIADTTKKEVKLTSLELEEAYHEIDNIKAENEELKASLLKKDEDIKAKDDEIDEAKANIAKAKQEAEEIFKKNEEYARQIEKAKTNNDRALEDERLRTLLPKTTGPGTCEINISQIASETIEEFDSFASKMDIVIRMVTVDKNLTIMADANRIRVMLRNIIDNSLKYMNTSGVLVITLSEVDGSVFIVCKDNGEGLSEEETEHVFELNFQGSNRISGNGLGLAQAKAIVDFYGGEISAKSNKGNGMAVYIKIPKKIEGGVMDEV